MLPVWKDNKTISKDEAMRGEWAAAMEDEDDKGKRECFEKCLLSLSAEERELILAYFKDDKDSQIKNRKNLAAQLGMTIHALRVRVFRIRQKLGNCISVCMERSSIEIHRDSQ
jgi:DNA-directed RNA polymerase specialized sigma24 family protein